MRLKRRLFGKGSRGISLEPAFSASTVYCFGEDIFECKLTVTLFRIPIDYGIQPVYELETALGLCCHDSLAFDTQH